MAQQSIGDVLRAQGDLFEALSAYQGSLAIRERLVKGDPANGQWQAALSDLQAAVSTMLRAQRLPGALESYGAETPAQLQTPAAYGNELAARSHIIMGWWALPVAKPGQPLVMDPRLQSLIDASSGRSTAARTRRLWRSLLTSCSGSRSRTAHMSIVGQCCSTL
jgi:hypothetical protein